MQRIDNWMNQLVKKMCRYIPEKNLMFWKRRLKKIYQKQWVEKEAESEQKAEQFILIQIKIILLGVIISLIFLLIFLGSFFWKGQEDILLKRNSFGRGSSQVALDMENAESSTRIYLEVGEQEITEKEWDELYDKLFLALGDQMKGKNISLQKVQYPLILKEKIEGYPFQLTYEVQDLQYIQLDGSLGKKAQQLKKGTLETKITVTADYQEKSRQKSYLVTVIPRVEKKRKSSFSKVIDYMEKLEKKTREKEYFTISGEIKGITVKKSGEPQYIIFLLLGSIIFTIGVSVHRYSALKEKTKEIQDSVIHDFPTIVHLLTLYMGAGLSFARTVEKISEDYQKGVLTSKRHFAFEQLVQMDIQMQMGMSQREACEIWAEKMEQDSYQKLSMLLIQGMSKGNRELKIFLQQIEQEAFQKHVDHVRKKGEEASTRLLLPMTVLMMIIMVLVMFPAMMQFQSF